MSEKEITIESQIEAVEKILKRKPESHNYCPDTFYSCPKHPEGCANDYAGDECDCGADDRNLELKNSAPKIQAALATLRRVQEMMKHGYFKHDLNYMKLKESGV